MSPTNVSDAKMSGPNITRRNFLMTSLAVAGGVAGGNACQTPAPAELQEPALSGAPAAVEAAARAIPTRMLGQTGIPVPVFGLGGAGQTPLSRPGEEREAIALVERALELGIRYFDTAASYGASEERLGKALPAYRSSLFLASKTGARDRDGAWKELEESLVRLQTDHLDLWQFHALAYDWDLDTILDRQNGAIRAAEEAKQQGVIRYLGITGHRNPTIIATGLQRYPFDTALIPINAADKHTEVPFISTVLPIAQQQKTGVIAMKVPAYGRLIDSGTLDGMQQAMGYALSQPGVHSCIIAAETIAQLEHNVEVAQAFQPLSDAALTAIEQRTAANWQEFSFFRSWS